MKHFYILSLSFLLSLSVSFAQDCNVAKATLNDNFESYEAGGNLAGCWTAIKEGSMVSGIRNTEGNANSGEKYAFGYTFNEVNKAFYFVTPKLNTIDGSHGANFYLGAVGAEDTTTTYELGTLSDPKDATTFSSVVSATRLPMGVGEEGKPEYVNANHTIPTTTDEYVAIKIISSAAHTAIYLDDFKWEPSLSISNALADTFRMYPNPSSSKEVYFTFKGDNNNVVISSVTGQEVYNAKVNHMAKIDLSHVNAGVYIVNVKSNKGVITKKLVLN